MPVKHTWKVCDEVKTGMLNPIKAIRQNCIDCMAGAITEITRCVVKTCALHPFRMGKDPSRKRLMSEDQRQAASARLKKARDIRQK